MAAVPRKKAGETPRETKKLKVRSKGKIGERGLRAVARMLIAAVKGKR